MSSYLSLPAQPFLVDVLHIFNNCSKKVSSIHLADSRWNLQVSDSYEQFDEAAELWARGGRGDQDQLGQGRNIYHKDIIIM